MDGTEFRGLSFAIATSSIFPITCDQSSRSKIADRRTQQARPSGKDSLRYEQRLTREHGEAMQALADANDRTLNAEVRRAVREYLERQENGK